MIAVEVVKVSLPSPLVMVTSCLEDGSQDLDHMKKSILNVLFELGRYKDEQDWSWKSGNICTSRTQLLSAQQRKEQDDHSWDSHDAENGRQREVNSHCEE